MNKSEQTEITLSLQALQRTTLVYTGETREVVERPVPPTVFQWPGDDTIRVSAEDGKGWAEYYSHHGYPWVEPKLEEWAQTRGYFWEWVDPGHIALYPA